MLIRIAVLVLGVSFWSQVQAANWQVDQGNSQLGFAAVMEGIPFDGIFRQWQADIRFDPQSGAAEFDVRVQPGSVDSNMSERDDALRMPEWFGVEQFPEARFIASGSRALDAGGYASQGTLALKGYEQPVTIEFRWEGEGDSRTMIGTATVNRLNFAVGEGEDFAADEMVGHTVKVWFSLNLKRSH